MYKFIFLIVTLIVYGSLFPFDYVKHSPTLNDFNDLFLTWPDHVGRIDAIGNIILFIPFGIFITTIAKNRLLLLWIILGFFLAWGIQYLQYWFPARVPSSSDAFFNMIGIIFGIILSFSLQGVAEKYRKTIVNAPSLQLIATTLIFFWILYRWFPLVPTTNFQNIKNGFKPLFHSSHWDYWKVLHDTVAWLVFFRVARYSIFHRIPSALLTIVAVGVVMVEPIFEGNEISWSNIIGLTFAIFSRQLFTSGKRSLLVLICLQILSIIISALAPFEFFQERSFLWLPFSGLLEGSMGANINALIEKLFIYGSLLFLMGYYGLGLIMSSAMLAFLLIALEWIQCWVPGRTPEITDALLAIILGTCIKKLLMPGGDNIFLPMNNSSSDKVRSNQKTNPHKKSHKIDI